MFPIVFMSTTKYFTPAHTILNSHEMNVGVRSSCINNLKKKRYYPWKEKSPIVYTKLAAIDSNNIASTQFFINCSAVRCDSVLVEHFRQATPLLFTNLFFRFFVQPSVGNSSAGSMEKIPESDESSCHWDGRCWTAGRQRCSAYTQIGQLHLVFSAMDTIGKPLHSSSLLCAPTLFSCILTHRG